MKEKRLRTWTTVLLVTVIVVALVPALRSGASVIEGYLFPVATATEIRTETNRPTNQVLVFGGMEKRRDCVITTLWVRGFLPGLNIETPVSVRTDGSIRKFTPGSGLPFGPWTIEIQDWQQSVRLVGFTTHECHPLWQTQTKFFEITVQLDPSVDGSNNIVISPTRRSFSRQILR